MKFDTKVILYFWTYKALNIFHELFILGGHNKFCQLSEEGHVYAEREQLLMTHFVMLQRNLVYTGITRAKKICIIIGTTKALAYSIHNMVVQKRNTKLKERLSLRIMV